MPQFFLPSLSFFTPVNPRGQVQFLETIFVFRCAKHLSNAVGHLSVPLLFDLGREAKHEVVVLTRMAQENFFTSFVRQSSPLADLLASSPRIRACTHKTPSHVRFLANRTLSRHRRLTE